MLAKLQVTHSLRSLCPLTRSRGRGLREGRFWALAIREDSPYSRFRLERPRDCRGVCFYAREEWALLAARAIARIVSESLGEFVERGAGDGGAEQCLQLGSVGE